MSAGAYAGEMRGPGRLQSWLQSIGCVVVALMLFASIPDASAAPKKKTAKPAAAGQKTKASAESRKMGSLISRRAAAPEIRLADIEIAATTAGTEGAKEKDRRSNWPLGFGAPKPGSRSIYSAASPVKRPLVVIDPGHGGDDLGAVGVDGLIEKDVALKISNFLDSLLRERLRARTVITRTADVAVALPERTRIANDNQADLFISLHANASENRSASGIETYYLDNTDNKASLKLAERENQAGIGEGAGGDLSFIVSDLIQNAKLDDSIALAHHVQDELVSTLSRSYRGVKGLGVKKAPFYVLVGAHMPCVLVEVSFIDHPIEGLRLADERYQRLIAQAIFQAVRTYFEGRV